MTETCERGIRECVSVARTARGVRALKNTHLICEIFVFKCQHAADSGGEVRRVRLKLAGLKCALKRAADFYDCVRLVAVCDDYLVFVISDCGVNNEARVLDLRSVERLGVEHSAALGEYAVAAVCRATHDEICGARLCAVGALADDDASAYVGIALDELGYVVYFIDIHYFSSAFLRTISSDIFSAAAGSIFHSASRMTLFWSVSGVSPSLTLTAFCMIISPPSGISLTK